jgi:GT2 family glycosyltransferase
MKDISIIIPFVPVDEETQVMTDACVKSFEQTMAETDEIILVQDIDRKGNAWAWNEGARRARGSVLLFSDNDIIAEHWREEMLTDLKDYTVVFPVVFNERIQQDQYHLAGECWMIKRYDFYRLGGIDEYYGSYFEDTDFYARVNLNGGTLHVTPNTKVKHLSQGTFRKIKTEAELKALFGRNKAIFEAKYPKHYWPTLA